MTALQTLQNTVSSRCSPSAACRNWPSAKRRTARSTVTLTADGVTERMSSLVAQSIEVIRNRIDEVGTTEPIHPAPGQDRVLVQVPGFGDFDAPQGPDLADRAPDLPSRPSDHDRRRRPKPRAFRPAT